MPNGYSYAPSGLPYIPDISLPQQLQPSLPQLTPSGLGYIPDVQLPQQLKPPTLPDLPTTIPVSEYRVDPTGLSEKPVVYTETYIVPEDQPGGYGPIEFLGDVAKYGVDLVGGAAGTLIDVGGDILSNLEVGIGTNLASYGYGLYQTYEQKKLAEKMIDAQRGAGYVVGAPAPGTTALAPTTSIAIPAAAAAAKELDTKVMIKYAIYALIAYFVLKGFK